MPDLNRPDSTPEREPERANERANERARNGASECAPNLAPAHASEAARRSASQAAREPVATSASAECEPPFESQPDYENAAAIEATAARYAARLLKDLELTAPGTVTPPQQHPALRAADCGLMALTGVADAAPKVCIAPLAACADGAWAALLALVPTAEAASSQGSGDAAWFAQGGAMRLTERAAHAGHRRRGAVSPGGSCHLLDTANTVIAVNLARADDWRLLPAWLEDDGPELEPDPEAGAGAGSESAWRNLAARVMQRDGEALVARARLLGLAACAVQPIRGDADAPGRGEEFADTHTAARPNEPGRANAVQAGNAACRARTTVKTNTQSGRAAERNADHAHDDVRDLVGDAPAHPVWQRVRVRGATRTPPGRPPRVLDLSSLWAGPLCAQLLRTIGAQVIKVESTGRPDGARAGPPGFFDALNHGKRSVALDLASSRGWQQLLALIAQADIVIEASRPRALRQLGIDAEALVRAQPGLTWLSISGYGRDEPQAQWIAYGDDAGVAAGLSALMSQTCGERLIVGDAIADPLTGLHAALAAWANYRQGGAALIELSLVDVVRHCRAFELPSRAAARQQRYRDWTQCVAAERRPIAEPKLSAASPHAAALGADTAAVLAGGFDAVFDTVFDAESGPVSDAVSDATSEGAFDAATSAPLESSRIEPQPC